MALVPIIIDSMANLDGWETSPHSVLSLPAGVETILEHAYRRLAALGAANAIVLRAEGVDPAVKSATHALAQRTRVLDASDAYRAVEDAEPRDLFLILDTRSWPTIWPSSEDLRSLGGDYRGVTHAIAATPQADRAVERVECDLDGQVRRVNRLYGCLNWPEVGDSVAYSLVPARYLSGTPIETLSGLRHELAARGVLSRDKPVACHVIDLREPASYLSLSERLVAKRASQAQGGGQSDQPVGVLVESGARVAGSARLVPPVIVGKDAVIEENALVVGPALIAAGGRIHCQAVVAQSVVLAGAEVPPGCVLRQQVYGSGSDARTARARSEHMSIHEMRGASAQRSQPKSHRGGRGRAFACLIKRLTDVVASAAALVVLAPLFLLVGILIRLDSRGPVLFGHVREGRGGREFRCLKFRTMVPDADARQRELVGQNLVDGPQFKIVNDPRVTRVGRWLRATNIDELPQLINVLLGHMSLVGPRPSPFRENQICVAWRQARLSVRPGITGLWQICRAPDRSQGDFHEWIYYDLAYVRRFSLGLDFKILLATLLTLGGLRHVPPQRLICDLGRDEQQPGPATRFA